MKKKMSNEFKQLKNSINYASEIINCEYDEYLNNYNDELGDQLEWFLTEAIRNWNLLKKRDNN